MAGIFKAYDIRGVVGQGLDTRRAYFIGRALAQEVFNGDSPILVSRDMRPHSPEMAGELARGLCDGGCDVLDIGLAATPMNYWANNFWGARGSVQVTASHNGPEYNGFKVSGQGAVPLDYATGLDKVEAFVLKAESDVEELAPSAKIGTIQHIDDALPRYLEWMDSFLTVEYSNQPLKIGIDAANGMGGFFLTDFFARHDWLELVPLFFELDGTFPNHEADPLKEENLRDTQRLVVEHSCDFGVAFDGDADRCMFVDEKGDNISSDLITALIGASMLESYPDSAILYDLRSSRAVPETIAQHGGTPIRGRVGHSFMKRLLKAENAPFGGELSGHYYFRDCFNTDSGLMALIQVTNIWAKANAAKVNAESSTRISLSQLMQPLRKYSATGEINFHVGDVKSVLNRIEEHYAKAGARLDHLDGLTVEFDDWWFNLRSSNTEPLLRLNLEAANATERDHHRAEVEEWLK